MVYLTACHSITTYLFNSLVRNRGAPARGLP